MIYLYGLLIFWSGCFVGFIAAAIFAIGRDADEYEHTDYRGEK
jgi:hypothetical protein